jgi:hypothetical protein
MNSTIDVLFLRRPKIDYISPPVCEVLFSSSSGPVIVLNPITPQSFPTGLVLGGTGNFFLSWNTYPGALCYSVYKSVNPDDAFGEYVIVAECIPNPPIDLSSFGDGFYRVSAITTDGETPLSLPIHFVGGGGGFQTVTVVATIPDAEEDPASGKFTLIRDGTNGNLTVYFSLTGDAINGIDYEMITSPVVIPDGSPSIDIDVNPISDVGSTTELVILTITPDSHYVIGVPGTATVMIFGASYTEAWNSPPHGDMGDPADCPWPAQFLIDNPCTTCPAFGSGDPFGWPISESAPTDVNTIVTQDDFGVHVELHGHTVNIFHDTSNGTNLERLYMRLLINNGSTGVKHVKITGEWFAPGGTWSQGIWNGDTSSFDFSDNFCATILGISNTPCDLFNNSPPGVQVIENNPVVSTSGTVVFEFDIPALTSQYVCVLFYTGSKTFGPAVLDLTTKVTNIP